MSDFLTAAAHAKAERRGALVRALAGLPAEPEPEADDTPKPATFDGGARGSVRMPGPSHGEFIIGVIQDSRQAGSGFGW